MLNPAYWRQKAKDVLVATNSSELPPNGVYFVRGDLAAAVQRLVSARSRRVYVDGGATIRALLAAGIIDDITLSVVPRILGDGIRLFDAGLPETGLRLVDSRSWASGLVQLRYEVERPSTKPGSRSHSAQGGRQPAFPGSTTPGRKVARRNFFVTSAADPDGERERPVFGHGIDTSRIS